VIPPDGVEVPCGLFDGDRDGMSPAISKSPLEVERVGVFVREGAGDIPSLSPSNKPQGTSTPSGGITSESVPSSDDHQSAGAPQRSHSMVEKTMAYQQASMMLFMKSL
jgi:hypothetical protein